MGECDGAGDVWIWMWDEGWRKANCVGDVWIWRRDEGWRKAMEQ